jgi:hypothetical protein
VYKEVYADGLDSKKQGQKTAKPSPGWCVVTGKVYSLGSVKHLERADVDEVWVLDHHPGQFRRLE